MQEDLRQKLISLIEELKIPISPEEAEEKLAKLSDEEVQKLVDVYQKVKNYNDKVDNLARKVNPEEYEKIEKEYKEDLAKAEEDYNEEMRQIKEKSDDELDAEDAKTVRTMEDSARKAESELKEIEDLTNELAQKVDSNTPKE